MNRLWQTAAFATVFFVSGIRGLAVILAKPPLIGSSSGLTGGTMLYLQNGRHGASWQYPEGYSMDGPVEPDDDIKEEG